MSYPDFVKKYKPKGTIVKCVNNQYYVYKATSKRVPEKTYPVQIIGDIVGKIDYKGFHKVERCICDISNPIIREFGFSRFLMKFVDDFEKRNDINNKRISKNLYSNFILLLSPQSYLQDEENFKYISKDEICSKYKMSICQQLDSILKFTTFSKGELEPLKYICSVKLGSKVIVGSLTNEQRNIIEKIGIKNDFPEYY